MKRSLIYTVLCVSLLVGMTGCYEDKSTEATHTIPEIVIDTTGIEATFTLKRLERLQVSPKVSKEGTDPSKLSYKWMLSMAPVKTGTNDVYECISEEKDLDAIINRDDDETTYRLWYQVTDNTTGLRKDIVWSIRVLAPYGEGLLVAEQVDGGTDLALIESEVFSDGYEDEPQIRHGIYSEANDGNKIDSDVFQMSAFKDNGKTKYYIILGKNGVDKYLLLKKTYKVQYRNEEGFEEFAAKKIDPEQFVVLGGASYLVNDNMLHWMWLSANTTGMKWGPPTPYQDGYVSLNRLACGGIYSGPGYSFYYDEENSKLKLLYNTCMRWDLATIADSPLGTGMTFNPQNCPGIELVYGGLAPDKRVYGLFKNEEGNYFVYGQQTITGYMKGVLSDTYYEIPTGELDNAIAYASNEMGNVIYFATNKKVYSIVLNAEPIKIEEIYSTNDEITHMSIFRQARNTTYSQSATLEGSATTLLIATWDGNKGTVNYAPIKNLEIGELEAETEWIKYEGFGKISTVIHQYP